MKTAQRWGALTALVIAVAAPPASAGVTQAGDALRTGWYRDQSALTRELVAGTSFGELFRFGLRADDQVDAQPLVVGDTLIVATETNHVYGLDARTGALRWHRDDLGTAMRTNEATGCPIPPVTGITSTPVVDQATGTLYLLAKRYASGSGGAVVYQVHAMNAATGAEKAGFPVTLDGFTADNQDGVSFEAQWELQRPGLLLVDGVVYAAFAGHCDRGPYEGWVVGVSTAGAIRARWSAVAATPGAGIWQSGGGLMSDGPGRIFLVTGNGRPPSGRTAGTFPPANLGESVVHLNVGSDGRLAAADFFAPFDAPTLEQNDVDFGSGGPVGLPDAMGTSDRPHLMVAVGKQGYFYILDRDELGGQGMGPGGGDDVVARIGPIGGVWSRPAVWPGDGGWIWVNTATAKGGLNGGGGTGYLEGLRYGVSSSGTPSVVRAAESSDQFSIDSGQPVITSDATTSGSSILWIVWAPYDGVGAQLRAYSTQPANGRPVRIRSWPIGRSSKFQAPGVASGRIYVTSRSYTDGRGTFHPPALIAFGSPVTPPLTGSSVSFPGTQVNRTSSRTATFTATGPVTVRAFSTSDPQFTVGTPSRKLPAGLQTGQTIDVPLTFAPEHTGEVGATLKAATTAGGEDQDVQLGLSGKGVNPSPELAVAPAVLSFGGVYVGGSADGSFDLQNVGAKDLVVDAIDGPPSGSPFSLGTVPLPLTIPPDKDVIVPARFAPSATGSFRSPVVFHTNAGDGSLVLSGSAGTPGRLRLSDTQVSFGDVAVGDAATRAFTLTNVGGSGVTITRSFAPGGGRFVATAGELVEGTTLAPGGSLTQSVRFTPGGVGPASDAWDLNADDGQGRRAISFTGNGVADVRADAASSGPPPGDELVVTPPGPSLPDPIARLTRLRMTPEHLGRGTRARVTYLASERTRTKFVVQRPRGRRWRAMLGASVRWGGVGANGFRFRARLRGHALRPGRYRLTATPVTLDGRRGLTRSVRFTVVAG